MANGLPPGLAGFVQGRQDAERSGMNAMQQAQTLAQLSDMQFKSDVQRESYAESKALEGLLAQTGGDPSKAINVLIAKGTPKSLELAAKLKGLVAKPGGQAIGSGGLKNADGTITPPQARVGDTPPQSPLARMISERDALPPNDPRRPVYDAAIKKHTEHQAPVNVNYSGSVTEGIDEQGNPVFFQPSPRPGEPPKLVRGVRPKPSTATVNAGRAERETEITIENVRDRVGKMSALIQGNTGVVGPAGIARRVGETAVGVVSPNIPTPAIDFENERRLLVADIRKMVEKDPNLSNQERKNLEELLGSGLTQTPGSSIRTLDNVLKFVERKKLTGPGRGAGGRLRFDVNGNPIQ